MMGAARSAIAVLVVMTLVGWVPRAHAESGAVPSADEYRVKAAVLYNIARFVEWPASAFPDAASPVVLCIVGADPFGGALDETLKGRTIVGRQIAIKRVADARDGCHVVFIAYSEQKRVADLLDRLGTAHALTISDIDRFTERGGVVGLATAGDRVRFDVNIAAAERARLTVSARVLSLASAVRRTPGADR
jgi:hypothetical protein